MGHRNFRFNALFLAVVAAFVPASVAFAADQDVDKQLGEMVIKSDKPAVPANLPATTEGVTARQIAETSNAVTTAAMIEYLPSVHVRERYIGDRNAIVQMRTNSAVSSAQTIVYADGLLLSNFTNNSFSTPPRWGMVSPEEIERIDVIYGPFSALYPGNSMSGVVLMTTRMPERFEAHAKVDTFGERFKLYGTDKDFVGTHGSASAGGKTGEWSFWMSGDFLDNHGHPMTFGNATRVTPQPGAATAFTTVSGGYRDIDTTGAPRIITSSIGADHTVQDIGKIKIAYDFTPAIRATYSLGYWQNTSDTAVASYLQNAAGTPVYNTTAAGATKYVKFAGDSTYYTLSGVSPTHAESEHWMHGLAIKSNTRGEWDGEAVLSFYNQNKDISRSATNTGSLFDSGTGQVKPGGLVTFADGTGWETLDLRGEWRPSGNLQSTHQVSFGYHYDRYTLSSDTFNTSDWLNGSAGTLNSNSKGKTETQGLYLQDVWRFAPAWQLVLGGRQESWIAFDGSNFSAANTAPTPKNVVYADRNASAFSPKASLSFEAAEDWSLRGSFGKAYRFPTVSELFQLINFGPGTQRTNDPNLKPEQVRSAELTAEHSFGNALWRTSLFRENKRDGLISQTNTTVTPNVSSIQNVDKILTNGIEMALQASDLWIRGFDLSGSVTYTDSVIKRNSKNPAVVGRDQPRIPDWRASVLATYRASDQISYSMAVRYSGRQWASLAYTDINPNVYGTPGVSSYTVIDAKVLYHVAKQWTGALGVNNLGNYKYYVQPNPYPQRTLFASLKFDY